MYVKFFWPSYLQFGATQAQFVTLSPWPTFTYHALERVWNLAPNGTPNTHDSQAEYCELNFCASGFEWWLGFR